MIHGALVVAVEAVTTTPASKEGPWGVIGILIALIVLAVLGVRVVDRVPQSLVNTQPEPQEAADPADAWKSGVGKI